MQKAEEKIRQIAHDIVEDFQLTNYNDKDIAIADYKNDQKQFVNLSNEFIFNTKDSDAHKELGKRLIEGYKTLPSDIKKQFKKEFFKNVEKRCPFCGQLLETSGKTDSEVPTADLDHFFPKAKYPQFALNPQNLIPTCMECNRIEKHIKKITPKEFKFALVDLKLLNSFQKHPYSHFKIFKSLDLNMNNENIINFKSDNVQKLINLYGLEQRYQNIKNKSYNILINIIRHSDIRSPESLERLLDNMSSANWHEINDGYSINNSPQIWQEFIENILYDECKLLALWDEVKSTNFL